MALTQVTWPPAVCIRRATVAPRNRCIMRRRSGRRGDERYPSRALDSQSAVDRRCQGVLLLSLVLRQSGTAAGLMLMIDGRNNPHPPRSPSHSMWSVALPAHFSQAHVSIRELQRDGVPFEETVYLTIGGGLGSFAWVDHLRIFGARADQIIALGLAPQPHARLERLCRYSQIPSYERLRSNSDACPDNLWGWPGYAVRECWRSLWQGDLRNAAKVLWQVFCEPTFAETYTPRAGDVYAAIEREAARIGWGRIWRNGGARGVRKTDDGRYVVAYAQAQSDGRARGRLIVAQYVHVAVGHPAARILPEVQEYRAQAGDSRRVVNAYEPHEHIYDHLLDHGGVVLVR